MVIRVYNDDDVIVPLCLWAAFSSLMHVSFLSTRYGNDASWNCVFCFLLSLVHRLSWNLEWT